MNVLGVGTDITECLRIAQMIERHGELFVGRVYTPLEIEYWLRGISWRDIEIRNAPGGRPQAFLQGGTQEIAAKLGIHCILVSISHCRSHATAYAVALDETPTTFTGDSQWT
jgi:holo-[acyl-carrier protein] synthase